MKIERGDIFVSSIGGKHGKPRLWLTVQTNLLNQHLFTILAAPLTSEVNLMQEDFRPIVKPRSTNGLTHPSQIMLDRLMVIEKEDIVKKIGVLEKKEILNLNQALAFVLGI